MNLLTNHRFALLVLVTAMAATRMSPGPAVAAAPAETARLAADHGYMVPDFGPNVLIFDPSMKDIQGRIDAVFRKQEHNQFGSARYAYLFKPGAYNLDVAVGFYVHVAGLGQSPDDVAITGAVRSMAALGNGNATCNFWRAVENLSVTPTRNDKTDVWAVSQGVTLRRTHVKGNLNLWDGGWSSGGFMSDCKIDGQVNSGSQQQWFSRNTEWGKWVGGSWNMVFVGTVNPPSGNWPARPYTVIDQTPVAAEKPYLYIDGGGHYFVMVPSLTTTGARGTTWSGGKRPGRRRPWVHGARSTSSIWPMRKRTTPPASTPRSRKGRTCCSRRASIIWKTASA